MPTAKQQSPALVLDCERVPLRTQHFADLAAPCVCFPPFSSSAVPQPLHLQGFPEEPLGGHGGGVP